MKRLRQRLSQTAVGGQTGKSRLICEIPGTKPVRSHIGRRGISGDGKSFHGELAAKKRFIGGQGKQGFHAADILHVVEKKKMEQLRILFQEEV